MKTMNRTAAALMAFVLMMTIATASWGQQSVGEGHEVKKGVRFNGREGAVSSEGMVCVMPCTLHLDPGSHRVRLNERKTFAIDVPRNGRLQAQFSGGVDGGEIAAGIVSVLLLSPLSFVGGLAIAGSSPNDSGVAALGLGVAIGGSLLWLGVGIAWIVLGATHSILLNEKKAVPNSPSATFRPRISPSGLSFSF